MSTAEWTALTIAVVAFVGSLINSAVTFRIARLQHADRRSDRAAAEARSIADRAEADRRERRGQAVEIYLQAAAQAASTDAREVDAGVAALRGLLRGDLLDDSVKVLVEAAIANAYAAAAGAITDALVEQENVVVQGVARDDPKVDIERNRPEKLPLAQQHPDDELGR